MKSRLLVILGSVSVALAAVASFGSGAGAAGSAVSPSGVPVLLPASALAPTHAGGCAHRSAICRCMRASSLSLRLRPTRAQA